jgi:hypothetical protein
MSVLEVYQQSVLPLTPPERLQLATMILTDIAPTQRVDEKDYWTDEDFEDARNHSGRLVAERLAAEEADG